MIFILFSWHVSCFVCRFMYEIFIVCFFEMNLVVCRRFIFHFYYNSNGKGTNKMEGYNSNEIKLFWISLRFACCLYDWFKLIERSFTNLTYEIIVDGCQGHYCRWVYTKCVPINYFHYSPTFSLLYQNLHQIYPPSTHLWWLNYSDVDVSFCICTKVWLV